MSAHCNDCGTDIVYPPGTWPLGICPVCELRAELAASARAAESATDALRDVLDVTTGFTRAMNLQERHDAIDRIARAALAVLGHATPAAEETT